MKAGLSMIMIMVDHQAYQTEDVKLNNLLHI